MIESQEGQRSRRGSTPIRRNRNWSPWKTGKDSFLLFRLHPEVNVAALIVVIDSDIQNPADGYKLQNIFVILLRMAR